MTAAGAAASRFRFRCQCLYRREMGDGRWEMGVTVTAPYLGKPKLPIAEMKGTHVDRLVYERILLLFY